jgi:hypothetical protein
MHYGPVIKKTTPYYKNSRNDLEVENNKKTASSGNGAPHRAL